MGVVAGLQRQAVECEELGSPMYAELLRRMVDDYELGGASTGVLGSYEGHEWDEAIALPLLGAVHRLVLSGEAPELAGFYPSVGGEWDPVLGWEAFEQVLQSRAAELRAVLLQPPQTNEVRRSVALYGGLLQLVEQIPLPVRLCEIGSSAGLNLRADHFRFNLADGTSYGPEGSPVVIENAWSGQEVPRATLRIAERVGSDLSPVNPLTEEGARTLTSYVWADQLERLARLRGALAIAREVPADLRREDAVSFVRGLELSEGHVTVLWHSIMWHYLTPADQAAVDAALAELGATAGESTPLARLRLESPSEWGDEFLVELQTWPGGVRRVLGRADPHGQGMVWDLPFEVS
ncbi:DUF2332 domain-containing protein [Kribbella antibiotica]|uniref:DUF2332 domain-containing protein n=1 Tax=Kribbella antibiotica TaxID=190195 RepID=A0A4R4ZJT0_9ACTN|nr:DUF2332 domain-containing protein [Kribbella antibiotica]TDD57829.1 DUF2332 domain-containing protein [Kribbella antibiotica]